MLAQNRSESTANRVQLSIAAYRRQVLLLNPRVFAWVYFLNPQIPRGVQSKNTKTNNFHNKAAKTENLEHKVVEFRLQNRAVALQWLSIPSCPY